MVKIPNQKAFTSAVEGFLKAAPTTLSGWWRDSCRAAGFFTNFPVTLDDEPPPLSESVRAFPLVGAAVGLVAGLALAIAAWLGLPPLAAAFIGLTVGAVVTGALHEDGLADMADGFGAGRDRTEILKIMRDDRLGVFGMLALVFAVGTKAALLASLTTGGAFAALIAAGALSRAVLPLVMAKVPPARRDGLARGAGKPEIDAALTAALLGGLIGLLVLGPFGGIFAAGLAVVVVLGVIAYAQREIGGTTGDVLGAIQQAAEIAVLAAAAITA